MDKQHPIKQHCDMVGNAYTQSLSKKKKKCHEAKNKTVQGLPKRSHDKINSCTLILTGLQPGERNGKTRRVQQSTWPPRYSNDSCRCDT